MDVNWESATLVKVRKIGTHSYMAARDGVVYDEENPSESIDAAWDGEAYSEAVETEYDVSEFDDWVTIEIVGGGGTWRSRHYGTVGDGYMGDTPGESAVQVMFSLDV